MLILQALLIHKNFLAIILFSLLILSSFVFPPVDVLTHAVAIIGTAVILDILLSRTVFIPSAALVSGLIISLLISPQSPIYIGFVASFIAILGKHIGRKFFDKIIFNPAALGIFMATLIFNEPVSWWGVSWGYVPLILITLFVGYLVFFRMKRWAIPLPFLAAYSLVYFFLNPIPSTLYPVLIDPTLLFFSLVMLPEPTTSPNDHKRQIFYGIFVAIVGLILSSSILNSQFSTLNSIDPLLLSLLLGNLLFKLL